MTKPSLTERRAVGSADTPQAPSRRDLLKLAAAGAPAAAIAAVTGPAAAQADAPVQDGVLRDTEHTRAYYAAARF